MGVEERVRALEHHLIASTLMLAVASAYFLALVVDDLAFFALAIVPAMIANGSPVVAAEVMRKAGYKPHPVDAGRHLWGNRILGQNKTVEGLIVGTLAGTLTGAVMALATGPGLEAGARIGLTSGLGAMLGDLAGSFLKRRLGIPSGAPLVLADQLDFYAGAVLLLHLAGVWLEPEPVLAAAGLVFGLHVSTNCIAAKVGWKKTCP